MKTLWIFLYSLLSCHVAFAPANSRFHSLTNTVLHDKLRILFQSYYNAAQVFKSEDMKGAMDKHTLYLLLKNAGIDNKSVAVLSLGATCRPQTFSDVRCSTPDADSFLKVFDRLALLDAPYGRDMKARDYKIQVLESEARFLQRVKLTFNWYEGILKREDLEYLMAKLASLIEVDGYPKVGNPNIYWSHFSQKGITLPVLLEVFRAVSVRTRLPLGDILELVSTFPLENSSNSDEALDVRLLPVFRSYVEAAQVANVNGIRNMKNSVDEGTVYQIMINARKAGRPGSAWFFGEVFKPLFKNPDIFVLDDAGQQRETAEFSDFMKVFNILKSRGGRSMSARDYKIELLESEPRFMANLEPIFREMADKDMGVALLGHEAFESLIAYLLNPIAEYDSDWAALGFTMDGANKYYDHYSQHGNGLTLHQLLEVFRAMSIRTGEDIDLILRRLSLAPKPVKGRSLRVTPK